MQIPFNKPYLTGKELEYIKKAVLMGKISGNGYFTQKCHEFFQQKYGFKKCLLTTSCTDALEMAAILCNIQPGDEVIVPAYTFVSTANAFVLRGAKIIFADSRTDHPGIDESKVESLITPRTKVIVPVHYAGVSCDMDVLMNIANRHDLIVVEDAAQAIDSFYKGRPLGGIGHLGCFSFHETKNVQSGEGGMLVINDERFINRSEIIWEKGTNRVEFFKGKVDKYGWVDIGSSFLPSEIIAGYLWAQLENLSLIQEKRINMWLKYYKNLNNWAPSFDIDLPRLPEYSVNNAHMFYLICKDLNTRTLLLAKLKMEGIYSASHYQSLHKSSFYKDKYRGEELVNADNYSDRLLRLPFFFELSTNEINIICKQINRIIEKS